MNLRVSLVAGIVAVAGAVAAVRGLRSPAAAPADAFLTSDASPAPRRTRITQTAAPDKVVVYMAGDVARPGVYPLRRGARAVDGLRAAGGPLADADLVAVNLAEPLVDGQEVAVPVKGAPAVARPRSTRRAGSPAKRRHGRGTKHRRTATGEPAAAAADAPSEPVDVNLADESVLETLPGIGPALAGRIVVVRDQSGPFASLDDLLDVAGMTQTKLDELEPYVTLR